MPSDAEKLYLYIVITNIGRRPIFITGWGATTEEKTRNVIVGPRELPKILKESEYHIEYTDDLSIFKKKITSIYAWDSSGKYWKAKKKNFNRLMKQAQELKLV